VSEQSQRNPGNLAVFGIKNARRTAAQHKLVVGGGVNQLIADGPTTRLGDDYLLSGNDVIDLACSCKWLIRECLVPSL
jgi:hypothetical protein